MKQIYFLTFFISALGLVPFKQGKAQCSSCSGGTTPMSVSYEVTHILDTLREDDSARFEIMQFNPSLGELRCVEIYAYLTGIITMKLENDETYTRSYYVTYTRNDSVQGPGLSRDLNNTFSKGYGPYVLAPTDDNIFSGPDYMYVGPDTVLRQKYMSRFVSSSTTPFQGYGNLTYFYKTWGKTTVTGSTNYIFQIRSKNTVTVGIKYYYCQNLVLASSGLQYLGVQRLGNNKVKLGWSVKNELPEDQYRLEISRNGRDFIPISTVKTHGNSGNPLASYEEVYNTGANGIYYFRVIQESANGKKQYSNVQLVNMEENTTPRMTVSPNPIGAKFKLNFDQVLAGTVLLELRNTAGQIVYSRNLELTEGQQASLDLNSLPPAGVYYLTAKELKTNKSFGAKVMVAKGY